MNSSGLVHFLHPNSCFKFNVCRRSYELVKPALRIRGHRPDTEYSLAQPHLTASCSACLSGSTEAAAAAEGSPAEFSCVEDEAGERSVAPPPPLAEVDEDGAGVTVTATPADGVDEATAVSIATKRKKQTER